MMTKEYLGDAVYAEIKHGEVVVTTSDGVKDTNTIYLEPVVLDALIIFCIKHKFTTAKI